MTKTPARTAVRASRAKRKPEAETSPAPKAAKPRKAKVAVAKSSAVKPSLASETSATLAIPKSAAARPGAKPGSDSKGVLKIILAQADDMKAEDTVTIDLKGTSAEADYVVVTTGRSNRHVASIADRVVEGLRAAGVRPKVEGMANCDWVLIDAGDAIVHVFRPEVRTFYNLEKMWAGAAGPKRAS